MQVIMSIEWNLCGQYERESIISQTFLKYMNIYHHNSLISFTWLLWVCYIISVVYPQTFNNQTSYNSLSDENMRNNYTRVSLNISQVKVDLPVLSETAWILRQRMFGPKVTNLRQVACTWVIKMDIITSLNI